MARLIANGIAAPRQQLDSSHLIFKSAPRPLVHVDCVDHVQSHRLWVDIWEWSWCPLEIQSNRGNFTTLGAESAKTPIPKHLGKMLKGGLEMSQRRRCLGKCITKPQVLLWRFKILFMHKWTRTGTFSSTDSDSFHSPPPPFPATCEGLIRRECKSNLAVLRWESNNWKFWG